MKSSQKLVLAYAHIVALLTATFISFSYHY